MYSKLCGTSRCLEISGILLVVDNASDEPIQASTFSWNERLRVVREPVLGLTPARLTAIRGANTELLIFVDDDNLLCPEYLENAQRIARDWPTLGAGREHYGTLRGSATSMVEVLRAISIGSGSGTR